jgi:hypothetical protein
LYFPIGELQKLIYQFLLIGIAFQKPDNAVFYRRGKRPLYACIFMYGAGLGPVINVKAFASSTSASNAYPPLSS